MGHSFLEVWGVTFLIPITFRFSFAALTHRARGDFGVGAVLERCQSGVGAVLTHRARGGVRCRSVCQKGEFSLFKIEVEGDHAECGFVDALGVDFLCGVGEVVACFLQDVVESEAEFQFRNEFEEGQIDVAAQTCFQHEGEGARFDERAFACGEVIHWRDACHDVGAVVVEARRGNFEVRRNGKVA